MCWHNLQVLLLQERRSLELTAVPQFVGETPFESHQSAFLGSYLRTKAAVDAAVTHFAQTLEWPHLNSIEKYFVIARLDFAREIAALLNTARSGEPFISYPSPGQCGTSELLQWLLIDIWPYGCTRFLQSQRAGLAQSAAPLGEKLPSAGPEVSVCVA